MAQAKVVKMTSYAKTDDGKKILGADGKPEIAAEKTGKAMQYDSLSDVMANFDQEFTGTQSDRITEKKVLGWINLQSRLEVLAKLRQSVAPKKPRKPTFESVMSELSDEARAQVEALLSAAGVKLG